MIILLHEKGRLLKILHEDEATGMLPANSHMANCLFELAREFPERVLVWCDSRFADQLNATQISAIFHHKRIMCSYTVSRKQYIGAQIGYVESTPFINIKYDTSYPTWMMSSDIGGIHASILNAVDQKLFNHKNFVYFLNSLAKSVMSAGVFCYSEPGLLVENTTSGHKLVQASTFTFFKFIKQHYKTKWTFVAFWSFLLFEKRLPFFALLFSLFYKRKHFDFSVIDDIEIASEKKVSRLDTYDVLIPTIGRKQYLFDFLNDLADQTQLPKRVIVIEQNPDHESTSDLDYLHQEGWPFEIKHHFIHKTGACQARNLGFREVISEWLVLGDDDIRVKPELFGQMLDYAKKYGTNILTASCLKPGEAQTYLYPGQTTIFGSGSSLMKASLLQKVQFDTRYEFGFAEDIDFGMQLRNQGEDVIYCPYVQITHLKAPVGGFRTKFKLPWEDDAVLPLPSPTVLLYNMKHRTTYQLLGYKLLYFIRFYKKQKIRNPFRYLSSMRKKWNHSMYWASRLLSEHV